MMLDVCTEDLLVNGSGQAVRPVLEAVGRTVLAERVDDAEVPTFTLLRAELGLPWGDQRWWPAGGRHLAVVHGLPAVEVSHPTLALLERTLAGLHAWVPAADG